MPKYNTPLDLLKGMKDHCDQNYHIIGSSIAGPNQLWYTCKNCNIRFEIDVSCVLKISTGHQLKEAVLADQLLTEAGRERLLHRMMRL